MDNSILFFILAGILIAILVGVSIWSARREKSRIFSNTFSTSPRANSDESSNSVSGSSGFNAPHSSVGATEEQLEAEYQREVQNKVDNIIIRVPNQQSAENTAVVEPESAVEAEPAVQESMITLYVVAPEGQQFRGVDVVHCLEALGFQYGEFNIFHRHLDNTASPVLFSVANMMQPGVFDLNQIEQFHTVGLVFFMHLPSPSSDFVNLRLMVSTVERFAEAMGGFMLDEQRQLWNEETRQAYFSRVQA